MRTIATALLLLAQRAAALKIVVAGGTGGVGSAIAGRLAAKGHKVTILCRNAYLAVGPKGDGVDGADPAQIERARRLVAPEEPAHASSFVCAQQRGAPGAGAGLPAGLDGFSERQDAGKMHTVATRLSSLARQYQQWCIGAC